MTRYKMVGDKMVEHPDGEWVMYEDYVQDVQHLVDGYEDILHELQDMILEIDE